jgi:hypothetical protein
VQLPDGWEVVQQSSNEMLLADSENTPNGVDIGHDQSSSPETAQAALQSILSGFQQKYPDATECGDSAQIAIDNVVGTMMKICYTFTPEGGAAFPAFEYPWVATDSTGTSIYLMQVTAGTTNTAFWSRVNDVLGLIQWAD